MFFKCDLQENLSVKLNQGLFFYLVDISGENNNSAKMHCKIHINSIF